MLEVTARAITYYLDVSSECTRRIVQVEGAVRALCNRLVIMDEDSKTSKDLTEQCVKVLELVCSREPGIVFESGGLGSVLSYVSLYRQQTHEDTLRSALSILSRLITRLDPNDSQLSSYIESLTSMLHSDDQTVCSILLDFSLLFFSILNRFVIAH